MRFTLIVTAFIVTSFSFAQTNISGSWFGTSIFMKDQTSILYELQQDGDQISGFAYTKGSNGRDSTKVKIEGNIKDDLISLKGTEFIYRIGMSCLASVQLKYSQNGDMEALNGRWKGEVGLSTCPVMASGSVVLYKEIEQFPKTETEQSNLITSISKEDEIGNALVNQLKKRRYHALIIGIDQYDDDRIDDLNHPINDASKLKRVLIEGYSFKEEDVTFLQNPKREDIIESLDRLTKEVSETDNLLIFYAGHGIWNEQLNQGYWLPADASAESKSFWLSNSTLRDYVGGINSKHTLLISDACFSGGILKERAVFDNSRAVLEVYKLLSRKAMTSGTLKTVPDKSVFMEYLIKYLQKNEAPLLSADQLFRQFKIAVINNSPNGQVPQYGPISQAGDEGGDFVFLRRE